LSGIDNLHDFAGVLIHDTHAGGMRDAVIVGVRATTSTGGARCRSGLELPIRDGLKLRAIHTSSHSCRRRVGRRRRRLPLSKRRLPLAIGGRQARHKTKTERPRN
jgi:hypothetical protein